MNIYSVNGEHGNTVKEYKYLGTIMDNKFNLNKNAEAVFSKVNSRIYFVRKLNKLKIDNTIINLFHSAVIQSVISFSVTC